jgi:hypothetical protein
MKTNTPISEPELKNRPEQSLSTGSRPQIDFSRRMKNRLRDTESLLELMRNETPHFYEIAEVVGHWVWIWFDGKQPREVTSALAELGFHWNNSRQVWQHPCGTLPTGRSTVDPHTKYPSFYAADANHA